MFKTLKKMLGGEAQRTDDVLVAPVSGRVIPISQVKDPAFSQEVLGKGIAVEPSDGRVVAPAAGVISMVFDTKHAVSMLTDSGAEVIIHIGLDTVRLKGQYFEAFVKAGDRVKPGDPLVTFQRDQVLAEGYDVTTPMIICNTSEFPKLSCKSGMEAAAGETPVIHLR